MRKSIIFVFIIIIILFQSPNNRANADDATVLPKGIWRVYADGSFFLPITKRFNKDGNTEDVAKDFNANLNSSILPNLSLVEAGFGMTPGSATFGKSIVSFKWDIQQLLIQPAYGLTDRLSIGINFFYIWQQNDVNARLDNATATVGVNPFVPGGVAPIGFVAGGYTTPPPTTNDIQNLLVSQGFKKLESWSDSGLGDFEIGGKYQYYNSDPWRLAFTGGLRFPTGKMKDLDNLAARGFGTGAYALLFRLHNDYTGFSRGSSEALGVPDPGSFTLNTTFRYELYLPDNRLLRVCDVHAPLCTVKDDVDRKLGDVVEAEISGTLGLYKGLFFTPLYKFGYGFKDHYAGNKGLDYGVLGGETDYIEHIYKVGLSYSTLPLYQEHQFPIPMLVSITYRDRFAGNNNVFNSQFIELSISSYF